MTLSWAPCLRILIGVRCSTVVLLELITLPARATQCFFDDILYFGASLYCTLVEVQVRILRGTLHSFFGIYIQACNPNIFSLFQMDLKMTHTMTEATTHPVQSHGLARGRWNTPRGPIWAQGDLRHHHMNRTHLDSNYKSIPESLDLKITNFFCMKLLEKASDFIQFLFVIP